MPRIPRLERMFVKPNNAWSRFPKRPLPFRMAEWETKEHKGEVLRVTKIKPPTQIPSITPIKEWKIVRGDLVEILVGQDRGKQGKVRAVARKKNQLKVIGLNCSDQFIEDMGDGQPGYTLSEEPLHYTEVKLVDPATGKPSDVVYKFSEDGKRLRVCAESGRVIPKPPPERTDWKARSAVKEGELDTKSDHVQQYTYVPSLLYFHEEVMKEMNIPMSIPKKGLERRDLIFREIENESLQEKASQLDTIGEKSDVGGIGKMVQKLKFWQ